MKKILKQITLTRVSLIEFYIDKVKNEFTLISSKKNEAREIEEELRKRLKRISNLSNYTFIIYVFAYFSFVSYLLAGFFVLEFFKEAISKIISIFGTTFFIIVIFLLNYIKTLAYQDVNLLYNEFLKYYKVKK